MWHLALFLSFLLCLPCGAFGLSPEETRELELILSDYERITSALRQEVSGLKSDLAVARRQAESAQSESEAAKTESNGLRDFSASLREQISAYEISLTEARQEALLWKVTTAVALTLLGATAVWGLSR